MTINWERRHEAFKALYDKMNEVLLKLDQPTDPQTVEIIKSMILSTLARNRGNLVNGYFENDFEGWDVVNNAEISTDDNFPSDVGSKSCKFPASGAYIGQIFTPAIYSNRLKSISFAFRKSGATARLTFCYQDGTISYSDHATVGAAWNVFTAKPSADKYIVAIVIKYQAGFGASYLDFVNFNLDPTTLPKLQDLQWFGIQPSFDPAAGSTIYSYSPPTGKTLYIYGLKLMTEDATMNLAEIYIGGELADIWLWWRESAQILIFQSKLYTLAAGTTFEIRNQNLGSGWYIADILGEEV